MAGEYLAFMSYARFDDVRYDEQISEFRNRLAVEVGARTGRKFEIFLDREHILWGQKWQEIIDQALDSVALLLVIITPGFFQSDACRHEIARFREREQAMGRSDLILPVYYIEAREIEDPVARQADEVGSLLASRQYADWRDLRLEAIDSPDVVRAIGQLARRMTTAFWRTPPTPVSPVDHGQPVSPGDLSQSSSPVDLSQSMQYQRWPGQPAAPPASPPPATPPEWSRPSTPTTPPMWVPKPQTSQPSPSWTQNPSTPWTPSPSLPGDSTPRESAAQGATGGQNVISWPPSRRTIFVSGTVAALIAAAGIGYAVVGSNSGPSAAAPAAKLAATLTVPGDNTVDTVWISPDNKRIAGIRTDRPSDIYVWNVADPTHPKTLTVPPTKVGSSPYPTVVENIAFSADDTSMTMLGYPTSGSAKQTYVLYQWDLTSSTPSTPSTLWSLPNTSSVLSFSQDNSTAVESATGGAKLVTILPPPAATSPLSLPGGSALSLKTSFYLDSSGQRMLYSPKRGTYVVWDLSQNKQVASWNSNGLDFLSPDGKTFLEFFYNPQDTLSPLPVVRDVATQNAITPADVRWREQLRSSTMSEAYVTYSKDGTVVTTERAGGKTDLWSTETGKFLTTINDPTYSDDSDYAVVGEHGSMVVIFGGKTTPTGHEFRQLYVWNTGLS